jgi:ribonuclease BN (tRNA processing enzyme)
VLTAFAAKHAVPSAALRFEDRSSGRVIAFSSDTADCEGVRAAARDADLFVCEATYLTASPQAPAILVDAVVAAGPTITTVLARPGELHTLA